MPESLFQLKIILLKVRKDIILGRGDIRSHFRLTLRRAQIIGFLRILNSILDLLELVE